MKFLLLSTILFSFPIYGAEWILDKSHSSVDFNIDHLMVSETTGTFKDFSIEVKADKPDFTDAQFSVTINTPSIDTKDVKRDEHLKGEDFFNVKKNGLITFNGKKFEKQKNGTYKVYGTLIMNGIQKDLILNGKFGGIVKDPWGGTRAGLKVFGDIDRYDFGLKYNSLLETGGLAIGRIVRITSNIELIKK